MQIDFAKACFGLEEIEAVNRVMLSPWLASGIENEQFEKEFAKYIGVRYAVCVNSGSSANLLSLASLDLKEGSRIVTSACGFPATLSPILHLRHIPILVDYDLNTFNLDLDQTISVLSEADAVIFAHTLGNPVKMREVIEICKNMNIPVIEDCCEAVGASYMDQKVGSYGNLGTFSFYPAHQMTALGGGGMVVTNDEKLYQRMKSMRDWGKMYSWDSDKGGNDTDFDSPIGYHRGYTYETMGWNFKLPETNCAFGREQLKKLDDLNFERICNFDYLYENLRFIKDLFVLPRQNGSAPFGLCMTVEEDRSKFSSYLNEKGIKHRPFFAGNILRHEPFKHLGDPDNFPNADYLMYQAVFVGCWPGLKKKELDYMIEVISAYFTRLSA